MRDLTGNRYGKLIALKLNGEKGYKNSPIWECKCDCGNTKFVTTEYLVWNRVKSCGCLKKGQVAEDLSGKKYGRLTVIKRTECPNKGYTGIYVYFLCKCDCGNEVIARATALKAGISKSCGCLTHELLSNLSWRGFEGISNTYFQRVKKGAIHRKIEFSITIEEAWEIYQKQNSKCALSGVQLKLLGKGSGLHKLLSRQTASLDRIDSSKGYIKENCQWVHKTINKMKNILPDNEFIDWCNKISNYNRKEK